MGISLVTLVKNRNAALINMINGITLGLSLPNELLIVHMNEETYQLPETPFPIRQICLNTEAQLPLAKARNFAVVNAGYEQVIFLDVDCIPDRELIASFVKAFSNDNNALLSGRVAYLPPSVMKKPDLFINLKGYSTEDPVRGRLDQYPYELFWSLNFACTKATFRKIGGFDENFIGYGAEDTDFGFMARKEAVPMKTINAFAFHQPHASYSPPLNHLGDIISNASKFHIKWGLWPMTGWLKQFEDAGLIECGTNEIHLIRLPDAQEIEQALKPY